MSDIRVRFAPSPTGYLHIGGVRTALYNYLFARHNNGKFLVRIEDTDRERSTEESVMQILDAMKWLGLESDEKIIRQSDRLSIYRELAEKLVEEGKAYYCACTKEELEIRKKEAEKRGVFFSYDGKCRERGLKKGDFDEMVIRLKVNKGEDLSFFDYVKGDLHFSSDEIDDFIIMRSDGFPTYNFAVVVDDAFMGITDVLRGDDHITNTPKQILIYKALGKKIPNFGHFPMILGSDKTRLSKRHGATSVSEYKANGILAEALLNYLAKLGWGYKDKEIFTLDELIKYFSLEGVNSSPSVFDPEKLFWVNSEHIKMKKNDDIFEILLPFLKEIGIDSSSREKEWFLYAIELLKPRAKTLKEMAEGMKYYFFKPDYSKIEEKTIKKVMKKSSIDLLSDFSESLKEIDDFSVELTEKLTRDFCEEREIKLGSIAQPVRVALTGMTATPGLFDLFYLFGKDETINRIKEFITFLRN